MLLLTLALAVAMLEKKGQNLIVTRFRLLEFQRHGRTSNTGEIAVLIGMLDLPTAIRTNSPQ